jgi:hypothetical protein
MPHRLRSGGLHFIKEKLMTSLKDRVCGDKQVTFVRYRDGELWYVTEDGFEFPVPVADIGNATFLARDKALLFMRYMRHHMDTIAQAKRG